MSRAVGKNTGSLSTAEPGTAPGHKAGSLPGKTPGNSSGHLPPVGHREAIEISRAIVLHFPTKAVAAQQDATEKAVESQRRGESAMSFRAAINMGRSNARARAMILRELGITGPLADADYMEAHDLLVAYALRQGQPPAKPEAETEPHPDLFETVH